MSVTKFNYELTTRDCGLYKKIATGTLFQLMQAAAAKSSEELGIGFDAMVEKNLIWVIVLQKAEIVRMPENREIITVETWPGKPMHGLFPRYYRILDAAGSAIVNGSSLWSIVDIDDRCMVTPEERGISFEYTVTGNEISRPRAPKGVAAEFESEFTVPFSFLDMNGHMNNTRYFDISEDVLPPAREGRTLKTVTAEYSSEVKMNETIKLRWGESGNKFIVTGETAKPCFKILFEYE